MSSAALLLELDWDALDTIVRLLRASDVLVTMCVCSSLRVRVTSAVRDGRYCLPNDDDPLELLAASRLLRRFFPALRHRSSRVGALRHRLIEASIRAESMASDTLIRLGVGSSVRAGALRERERVSLRGRLTHVRDFFLILEILRCNDRLTEVDLSNNAAVLHMNHLTFASALLGTNVKIVIDGHVGSNDSASQSSIHTVRNMDDLLLLYSASALGWHCLSPAPRLPHRGVAASRYQVREVGRPRWCRVREVVRPRLPHDVARWEKLRGKWSTRFVTEVEARRLQWGRLHDRQLRGGLLEYHVGHVPYDLG
jgi:hypothetical protein